MNHITYIDFHIIWHMNQQYGGNGCGWDTRLYMQRLCVIFLKVALYIADIWKTKQNEWIVVSGEGESRQTATIVYIDWFHGSLSKGKHAFVQKTCGCLCLITVANRVEHQYMAQHIGGMKEMSAVNITHIWKHCFEIFCSNTISLMLVSWAQIETS